MITAGIDVGLSGAIAFFDGDSLLNVYDMPKKPTPWGKGNMVDSRELAKLIAHHKPKKAVVERVHAMTGQGVSSMFSFGMSYQAVLSVLDVLDCQYDLVMPRAWQKHIGIVGKTGEGLKAVDIVEKLYPDAPIRGRMGGLKDGRCDAILIGLYSQK